MDARALALLMSDASSAALRAAERTDPADVAGVTRLRQTWDADTVHAALQVWAARRKAVRKWDAARASALWADVAGVEMATSRLAGAHKAARIARAAPDATVLDVCTGIGGDAMALRDAGVRVVGVEQDPARARCARVNAACEVLEVDAGDVPAMLDRGEVPNVRGAHVDPARREGAARTRRLADFRPSMQVVRDILARAGAGVVKLHPGVDFAELQRELGPGEVEVVSEQGTLTQALAWRGGWSGGDDLRRATLLSPATTHTLCADAAAAHAALAERDTRDIARFVYEPDDSIERAELLGVLSQQLGVRTLACVGLLTFDEPVASPFLRGFEVLSVIHRYSPEPTRRALVSAGAGIVEVKTRGGSADADALQRELSRPGKGQTLTLFVLRFGSALRAIIAKRLPSDV